MKHKLILLFTFLFFFIFSYASKERRVKRIDPPHWWVGMKNTNVQLLVYGAGIGEFSSSINYEGVKITKSSTVSNPNYLFIDVEISATAKAGTIEITFTKGKEKFKHNYQLKARTAANKTLMGITPADLIYMIMPDRFANGNTKNDSIKGLFEPANRAKPKGRHGGDIRGIINKLDYIESMGYTSLWLNPVFENNEKYESYHGYAITDHYKTDARLGTLEEYRELVDKMHAKGMKMVEDVIFNHIGDQHYLYQDLPDSTWFHFYPKFFQSNFRATVLMDPYAPKSDKEKFNNGWFDGHMPDVDQTNPFFANFLIQNTLWWIEEFGIDALRIDTYAYPDQLFMAEWGRRVKEEYPKMSMFCEVWEHDKAVQAWYTQNNGLNKEYDNNMPNVTDFQLCWSIHASLRDRPEWERGSSKIYYTLAQDFLYENPFNNVTFVDNHDIERFYSIVGRDLNKFKMGMGLLYTTRGIPCVFYGSEILMAKGWGDHGLLREDFWGGWPTDTVDKFTPQGRTPEENDAWNYLQKLGQWRKNSPAIKEGKLVQYIPTKPDAVYVYFRMHQNQKVMVIYNTNEKEITLNSNDYTESIGIATKAKNVITGEKINGLETLKAPAMSIQILELE